MHVSQADFEDRLTDFIKVTVELEKTLETARRKLARSRFYHPRLAYDLLDLDKSLLISPEEIKEFLEEFDIEIPSSDIVYLSTLRTDNEVGLSYVSFINIMSPLFEEDLYYIMEEKMETYDEDRGIKLCG